MQTNERYCQINSMIWLKHNYPLEEENIYHFANERKCSIYEGKLLKKMGVKSGVLDLFVSLPRQNKSGLWLEIKVGKNRLSKPQKDFLIQQFKNGFAVACCWELDAVKKVLSNYLSNSDMSDYFDKIIYEKIV